MSGDRQKGSLHVLILTIFVRIKSGEDARRLQGIGTRIAGKIDEMLKSGHIHKLDEIRGDEVNKAVHDLAQVVGIGGHKLIFFCCLQVD